MQSQWRVTSYFCLALFFIKYVHILDWGRILFITESPRLMWRRKSSFKSGISKSKTKSGGCIDFCWDQLIYSWISFSSHPNWRSRFYKMHQFKIILKNKSKNIQYSFRFSPGTFLRSFQRMFCLMKDHWFWVFWKIYCQFLQTYSSSCHVSSTQWFSW